MAYGFVYVMGHELMDGIYKIGMTAQTPLRRRDELSSGTAIPSPFDLLFYIEVDEPSEVEKAMHDTFSDFRVSDNREFFRTDLASIFKEFDYFKEEGGSPLAITYVGEGYLSCDAEHTRIMRENSDRFLARMNQQKLDGLEAVAVDQPAVQAGGA